MHKSGFVTVIGKPNVGKSTFINGVVGEKVAIVSSKPQTTRNTVRGIYSAEDAQIVFIDTPGVHEPKHKLGSFMRNAALNTLNAVDLVLYMINAVEKFDAVDESIIQKLARANTKTFLVVNKIDLAKDIDRLSELIDTFKSHHPFDGVFAVSAKDGTYTKLLLKDIIQAMPEGPKYYPEDMSHDRGQSFMIAELIREKVLHLTQQEIPHSVMVTIDAMDEDESIEGLMNIHASIIVERDSQKGIIIGKGGKMIKRIGTRARADILALLGVKVYLDLHCKVEKDWRNKQRILQAHGFKEDVI